MWQNGQNQHILNYCSAPWIYFKILEEWFVEKVIANFVKYKLQISELA